MTEELVGRIALLEQNCDENRAAIAGLVEKIAALEGTGKALAFSTAEDRMPITIKREGKSLWYRADKDEPNKIHHEIPANRISGVFVRLDIEDGEHEGKPTRVAILHMKCAHGIERIRMNGMLKANTSVAFKFFLQSLAEVPDSRLSGDLIFQVSEGNIQASVKIDVLNPLTERAFGSIKEMTSEEKATASEEGKKRWRDERYWQQELEHADQRINQPSSEPATPQVDSAKPVAIEPIAQKPRPELHDVEMSDLREEAGAAMVSANVSKEDAIAFVSRKFKKKQRIEMTFAELNDFIHWLNMVQIVHGEMDRIGFTFDQESEMVSQAGQLAKKRLESDRISALDTSDLEGAIEWLGQLADDSAQNHI